jgi:hypothetical protein
MNEEILKLTAQWYRLVGLDHHKDRDCHWYINEVWSYGQPPRYEVQHFGYVGSEVSDECGTHEEAEKILVERLRDALDCEFQWAKKTLTEGKAKGWGDDNIERAEGIYAILGRDAQQEAVAPKAVAKTAQEVVEEVNE